jgi:biotin carboxyl carrier protein
VKLAVEIGGRTHTVEVRRGANGEEVSLDGRRIDIDIAPAGRFWSLLIGRRGYEISIVDEPGGVTMVHVNGRAVPAVVTGAGHFGAAARRARPVSDGAEGPQRLVAPMPGRIVKLLARVGDAVTTRQGLVVIEAMKMENELRSPKTGTVTEIKVTEGASVEAGALLAIVE